MRVFTTGSADASRNPETGIYEMQICVIMLWSLERGELAAVDLAAAPMEGLCRFMWNRSRSDLLLPFDLSLFDEIRKFKWE